MGYTEENAVALQKYLLSQSLGDEVGQLERWLYNLRPSMIEAWDNELKWLSTLKSTLSAQSTEEEVRRLVWLTRASWDFMLVGYSSSYDPNIRKYINNTAYRLSLMQIGACALFSWSAKCSEIYSGFFSSGSSIFYPDQNPQYPLCPNGNYELGFNCTGKAKTGIFPIATHVEVNRINAVADLVKEIDLAIAEVNALIPQIKESLNFIYEH